MIDAADRVGLVWADAGAEVYAALFPSRGVCQSVFVQLDWSGVHRGLARVGVTLKLLHREYADAAAGEGRPLMGYDRFCRC